VRCQSEPNRDGRVLAGIAMLLLYSKKGSVGKSGVILKTALNFLRPNPYFGRGNWALTSAFSYRNSQAAFFAFPDGFGKYK
jgi:hypothetical protein